MVRSLSFHFTILFPHDLKAFATPPLPDDRTAAFHLDTLSRLTKNRTEGSPLGPYSSTSWGKASSHYGLGFGRKEPRVSKSLDIRLAKKSATKFES